jgi:NTP pyrophosphatase (non-canonical NTP hydrolase)
MMTFKEYSDIARQSDVYPKMDRTHPNDVGLYKPRVERLPIYPALALNGEAGEFAEKVKKAWRDNAPLNVAEAMKELGDVLWYIDAAAKDMGRTLEEVAQMNLNKISSRRARGVLGGSGDNR